MNNNTVILTENNCARVNRSLVLHTCSDDRSLGAEERNCLTLHVRAHQGTVCVIVLKERNHCRSNGNEHLGRNVHKADSGIVNLMELVTVTCHDLTSYETAFLIKRLVGLSNDKLVLLVCRHIDNLVKHLAVNNPSVRSFDEAVFVNLCKGCKVGDKSDIRTFGSLDGTHTAVMAVMNVSDFKSCTVTGKTAGAESRKTALMSKLGKGVCLIHEL